jgi:hypothetical protein
MLKFGTAMHPKRIRSPLKNSKSIQKDTKNTNKKNRCEFANSHLTKNKNERAITCKTVFRETEKW